MSRSGHATRRRSRQLALQTLYAGDFAEKAVSESEHRIDDVFERVAENFDLPEGARDFAIELARGTVANLAQIDALLTKNATNWKLSPHLSFFRSRTSVRSPIRRAASSTTRPEASTTSTATS